MTTLTETEKMILSALRNAPEYRADWREDGDLPEGALAMFELTVSIGRARSTVSKAVRSLAAKNLVDIPHRRRGLSKYSVVRLMTVGERDAELARDRRGDEVEKLESALNAGLGYDGRYDSGSIELRADGDVDDRMYLKMSLGALSEAKVRAVILAINAVDPTLLRKEEENDDE